MRNATPYHTMKHCFTVLLLTCASLNLHAASVTLDDYFPTNANVLMDYSDLGCLGWTLQYTGLGGGFFDMTIDEASIPATSTTVFREDASGYFMTTNTWSVFGTGSGTSTYDAPGGKFLEPVVNTGGTYVYNNNTYSGTDTISGPYTGTEDMTTYVLSFENVTVPLGTFNALKIQADSSWTDSTPDSGTSVDILWLVEGLGMVRYDAWARGSSMRTCWLGFMRIAVDC